MDDQRATGAERDPRFVSGPWTGFYLQHWVPGRNATGATLIWRDGTVSGTGSDRAGRFTVTGTYDVTTGQCAWTKRYIGKHAVEYRGVADGSGIWGVWEIRLFGGLYQDRGGFHLWPEGTNVSEASDRTEQAVLDAMRAEFENRPARPIVSLLLLLASVGIGLALGLRLLF